MFAIALAGCGSGSKTAPGKSADSEESGAADEFKEIDAGLHSQLNVQQQVALIAHDEDAYASMERSIRGPGSGERWRSVDFAHRMVVAVLAEAGGGGESISVDSLTEESGRLIVRATHTVPGRNCAVAAVISHPYAVVETRRIAGEESRPLNTVLRMKTVKRDC
ncbi:MAG: protease complex subunit PrcB family protein [Actinobacteria bacterium]|nr:protease complex subunit PrcB family protein [Actinomycetota bacterium]